MSRYDVVIIGGGPAGLTAGLYTTRAGLKSLVLESMVFGGQIINARLVENYPGFPDGITGFDLGELMYQQSVKCGLESENAEVTALKQGKPHVINTSEGDFEADIVIIAAGSKHRSLGVPGEEQLVGRGVSYCATCDGPMFRDKSVAVVGGGDTAITDALELCQHASKVYVIHRRDELRGGKVLQDRAFSNPKIEFVWNSVVSEMVGDKFLDALRVRNVKTDQVSILEVEGVFIGVGTEPNSQCFGSVVELDATGHIVVDDAMGTSVPGIFAAGDIRKNSGRQVSTAVGDGAMAGMSAFKYHLEQG